MAWCPAWGERDTGWVTQSGGKSAPYTVRSESVNIAAIQIRLKEVACAVKGQTNKSRTGGKDAPRAIRRDLVYSAIAKSGHKQIARVVKGQAMRAAPSEAKGALRAVRSEFINVANAKSATKRFCARELLFTHDSDWTGSALIARSVARGSSQRVCAVRRRRRIPTDAVRRVGHFTAEGGGVGGGG